MSRCKLRRNLMLILMIVAITILSGCSGQIDPVKVSNVGHINEKLCVRTVYMNDLKETSVSADPDFKKDFKVFNKDDVKNLDDFVYKTLKESNIFNDVQRISRLSEVKEDQKYVLNIAVTNIVYAVNNFTDQWLVANIKYSITGKDKSVYYQNEFATFYNSVNLLVYYTGPSDLRDMTAKAVMYKVLKDSTAFLQGEQQELVNEYDGVKYFANIKDALALLPRELKCRKEKRVGLIFNGIAFHPADEFTISDIKWEEIVVIPDGGFDWSKLN